MLYYPALGQIQDSCPSQYLFLNLLQTANLNTDFIPSVISTQ